MDRKVICSEIGGDGDDTMMVEVQPRGPVDADLLFNAAASILRLIVEKNQQGAGASVETVMEHLEGYVEVKRGVRKQ